MTPATLDRSPPSTEKAGLVVHEIRRPSFVESFVTVRPLCHLGWEEGARLLFGELGRLLARRDIAPIQEKVYGLRARRRDLLAIRADAFAAAGLDPGLPCTFIEGRPPEGGELGGVQVWGVTGRPGAGVRVETVDAQGGRRGRLWSGPGFRALHLAGVHGLSPKGEPQRGVTGQADRMFRGTDAALGVHGFGFRDVVRTWIYVARILDWYGELNRVRTDFFGGLGLDRGSVETFFPASTGIQGASADEACFMDVLALRAEPGSGVRVIPLLRSARQDPPFVYGSAFSRAASLEIEGRETVFVSGTASIGPDGHTRYPRSREAQVLETLLSIDALLETRGARLRDVVSATVFCKDLEGFQAFREVTRRLGVPAFPFVPAVADVCRHDLLVEIEAIARVPETTPSPRCAREETL